MDPVCTVHTLKSRMAALSLFVIYIYCAATCEPLLLLGRTPLGLAALNQCHSLLILVRGRGPFFLILTIPIFLAVLAVGLQLRLITCICTADWKIQYFRVSQINEQCFAIYVCRSPDFNPYFGTDVGICAIIKPQVSFNDSLNHLPFWTKLFKVKE